MALKTKIKNIFESKRKKVRSNKKNKKQLNYTKNKIAQLASSTLVVPSYIDTNSQCFQILDSLPSSYIESFYQSQLSSFQPYSTGNIVVNQTDFQTLLTSQFRYADDVGHLSGRGQEQVMLDFANYHSNKTFVIQPDGISGIIHRGTNLFCLSGSVTQSYTAITTSQLSGVTGFSLLGAAPILAFSLPLMGGIFFAGCERLAADTVLQPVLIVARDVCLIPTKFFELAYNEILVGPVLRTMGIDAPINISSALKFGAGTRTVLGKAVNGTVKALANAGPERVINIWKWVMK